MNGRPPLELRFHLGPFPVAIEPIFWLVALLFGLMGKEPTLGSVATWVAIVFVSVLVHELGHALAAQLLGSRAAIRLYSFGGLTLHEGKLTRLGEVAMSLAGPFAGLLLGSAAYAGLVFARSAGEATQQALRTIWFFNFFWALLNLAPVLPLDGGHVLLGVLGPRRRRAALLAGGLAALGIVAGAVLIRETFVSVLFALLAFQNLQAFWQLGRRPAVGAVALSLDEALQHGWDALRRGESAEALSVARQVLEQAPEPEARNRARDLVAWADLAEGNPRDALQQLERTEPPDAARPLTWALVLESLGEKGRAVPHAVRALEVEPSETAAALAVRLLASEARFGEALSIAERFAWPRPAARAAALGEVAFAQGGFPDAARHYAAAFELSGAAGDAYNAACSHARAGARAQACAWLERALGAGLDDPGQLATDPDLASLRGDPEFERLLARPRPS